MSTIPTSVTQQQFDEHIRPYLNTAKRGRPRLFNRQVYRHRFRSERSFAWVDKFRALLVRYDRKEVYFLGGHHVAFAMINLRHLLA